MASSDINDYFYYPAQNGDIPYGKELEERISTQVSNEVSNEVEYVENRLSNSLPFIDLDQEQMIGVLYGAILCNSNRSQNAAKNLTQFVENMKTKLDNKQPDPNQVSKSQKFAEKLQVTKETNKEKIDDLKLKLNQLKTANHSQAVKDRNTSQNAQNAADGAMDTDEYDDVAPYEANDRLRAVLQAKLDN